jgi:hypothetical protein
MNIISKQSIFIFKLWVQFSLQILPTFSQSMVLYLIFIRFINILVYSFLFFFLILLIQFLHYFFHLLGT